MTQKKIYWTSLTPRHRVVTVKVPDPVMKNKILQHYETGSGMLIWWNGREAREAQFVLGMRSSKTIRRRK